MKVLISAATSTKLQCNDIAICMFAFDKSRYINEMRKLME